MEASRETVELSDHFHYHYYLLISNPLSCLCGLLNCLGFNFYLVFTFTSFTFSMWISGRFLIHTSICGISHIYIYIYIYIHTHTHTQFYFITKNLKSLCSKTLSIILISHNCILCSVSSSFPAMQMGDNFGMSVAAWSHTIPAFTL